MSASSTSGMTPLMTAARSGQLQNVKALLDSGADVTACDSCGRTALHYCAENKETSIAEELLRVAPDLIDNRDAEGHTVMHMTVLAKNSLLLRLLLNKEADIDSQDNKKHTAVHWAIVCSHLKELNVLLERGARLDIPDEHGACPLHYAAQLCGRVGDSKEENTKGLDVLQKLLTAKVDVNLEDSVKRQPLLWAASSDSPTACAVLVDAGANVEASDKDGLTALHCAASKGNKACVQVLIEQCGASINSKDMYDCTALFYALSFGHSTTAEWLIEQGASLSSVDAKGRSPAHCAASSGDKKALLKIKSKGGPLWLRSKKREFPLHEACQGGKSGTVKVLLQERVTPTDVDEANKDGRTCMHLGAIYGRLDVLHVLVDAGAKVNVVMPYNVKSPAYKEQYISPLDAAIKKKHEPCVTYLRSVGAATAQTIHSSAAKTIQRYSRNMINKRREQKEEEERREVDKKQQAWEHRETEKQNLIIQETSDHQTDTMEQDTSAKGRDTPSEEAHTEEPPRPKIRRRRSYRKRRKPHPVQESVIRYEVIKLCSSERHRLRRTLMQRPPKAEEKVVQSRVEAFFDQYSFSKRPESARDFDEWESFLSEQLKRLEDEEEKSANKSSRPGTAASMKTDSQTCKTNDSENRSQTSSAVPNDREMSRLVERTETQMSLNRSRCSSSLSAYRERNQRMRDNLQTQKNSKSSSSPDMKPKSKSELDAKREAQLKLLCKAYYPLKVPVEVYYKGTPRTPRAQTARGGRLPGIDALDDSQPRGVSPAQYKLASRDRRNRTERARSAPRSTLR